MATTYLELQSNIESRFGVLRNSHVAGLGVFEALENVDLPSLDAPVTGVDQVDAATEVANIGFNSHVSAIHEAQEKAFVPGLQAAAEASSAATHELHGQTAQWAESMVTTLGDIQQTSDADHQTREADVQTYGEYYASIEQFDQTFGKSFADLGNELDAFARESTDTLKPEYLSALQQFSEQLDEVQEALIPQADDSHRQRFQASQDFFMEVSESAGNDYLQFTQSTLQNLDEFINQHFADIWENQVNRIKDTAIQKATDEIASSIAETELSVAISGALTPVMPQLIAFYKAADALEKAIGIWKDVKGTLGG